MSVLLLKNGQNVPGSEVIWHKKQKDGNVCRNNWDETEECLEDPINLSCLGDKVLKVSPSNHCYDPDSLSTWAAEHATDPVTRREYSREELDIIQGAVGPSGTTARAFNLSKALKNLRIFELVTASAHGVQMVVLASMGVDKTVPVSVPFVEWPERGNATQVFTYHHYDDGRISMTACIVGFFALSWVFQTLAVTVLWGSFKRWLTSYYIQPLRWLEYSISASLMAILFALLNGVTDTSFLTNIFAEFFLCMMLGLVQELGMSYFKRTSLTYQDLLGNLQKGVDENQLGNLRQNLATPRTFFNQRWLTLFLPHMLGWVAFLSPVSVFILKFTLAVKNSPQHPPSWVYFLYSFQFVIMGSFAFVQLWEQLRLYKATTRQQCERAAIRAEFLYTTLSLAAKSVLCWVLFVNVIAMKSIAYS